MLLYSHSREHRVYHERQAMKKKQTATSETTREVGIPFCGFYESAASYLIERDWESRVYDTFCDFKEIPQNKKVLESLKDKYSSLIENGLDYKKAKAEIVEKWIEIVSGELGIPLTFGELSSPREYNYTTDKIFCYSELTDLKKILETTPRDMLIKQMEYRHSSYDGFISYISNDITDWESEGVENWNCHQWETVIGTFIMSKTGCESVEEYVNSNIYDLEFYAEYTHTKEELEKLETLENEIDIAKKHTDDYIQIMKEKK